MIAIVPAQVDPMLVGLDVAQALTLALASSTVSMALPYSMRRTYRRPRTPNTTSASTFEVEGSQTK